MLYQLRTGKSIRLASLLCLFFISVFSIYAVYLLNKRDGESIPVQDGIMDPSTFTDHVYGISFLYPKTFSIKTYANPQGGYTVQLIPKNPININQPLQQAADSIYFGFSQETIEKILKEYQEDKYISNLVIKDVAVENKIGKKVSFTSGIGTDTVTILLPWKTNTLLKISYFPSRPEDEDGAYRQIIESVKQIN